MGQFSLEKWLQDKSRKVVTRYGDPVRIVCWDVKSISPIIGIIQDRLGGEFERNYAPNGRYSPQNESGYDLFFADEEEELTEFEKHVQAVMMNCGLVGCTKSYKDIDAVKATSKHLLDLARKELEKDHRIIDKYNSDWEDAYEQCKQDILKDFPKWKNITNDGDFYSHESLEDYLVKDILHPSGEVKERLVLKKTDLEKLPKEE